MTLPWSFLSSIEVFLDFEIKFSFFTIQGLSKSTIQKSASFPIDRLPLLILKIFAGLDVSALIIISSFTDPLWYNSKDKDNNVSIPDYEYKHADFLTKQYMGKETYPFKRPGEKRVILKIEPEKIFVLPSLPMNEE